ncbi:23S rRNA (adenine(1618)-N(6))-methyltransferase RlmF [Lewinella sp. W8]|uniref:23S rRNA (adenine(1618)-N(6))-methyltransferase RlmF n=1 Tax=Lewinella sp. W8 TaxID=2528208 RepID=UPI00106726F2|nr:23S rRNA (adenine(1618)-N(6))-methyltransferase RlmF [Lewinella sp. W8]MTB52144.1 23S rRNA (adenine(1618)-N(6))-methyltransferase RlmF [Lewinella sp. W8]
MHPRNRYRDPHDFRQLAEVVPELKNHFTKTPDGRLSLDFADPMTVRRLNLALLKRDYGMKHWDIPEGNLCPGIPGRLDYVHLLADLLAGEGPQVPETSERQRIRVLDVGVGASCIYPILGVREYGWEFVGSDVNDQSLRVAGAIVKFNPGLGKKITLRKQPQAESIFRGIIHEGEFFHLSMCNPPFYEDAAAARAAARRKWTKLGRAASPTLNFGGQANELWTKGGEPAFLRRMIRESSDFATQVGWFTTLVSQAGYLKIARQELDRIKAAEVKVLPMEQGGKKRRVLAWRY